jgi:hypothetical protein
MSNADEVANFANQELRHNALGLVVAESFDEATRERIEDSGLRVIDHEELSARVDIWDPLKQDAAVDAFSYYVCHIEKKMPLIARVRAYLKTLDEEPTT